MEPQQVGKIGETIAEKYFKTRGFHCREKNWHCRYGEIDLILEKNGELIFCEVKTRSSDFFGTGEESISQKKCLKLRRAMHSYLEKFNTGASGKFFPRWRFDIIAIDFSEQFRTAKLRHYQNQPLC